MKSSKTGGAGFCRVSKTLLMCAWLAFVVWSAFVFQANVTVGGLPDSTGPLVFAQALFLLLWSFSTSEAEIASGVKGLLLNQVSLTLLMMIVTTGYAVAIIRSASNDTMPHFIFGLVSLAVTGWIVADHGSRFYRALGAALTVSNAACELEAELDAEG